jgi:hypothetical protein
VPHPAVAAAGVVELVVVEKLLTVVVVVVVVVLNKYRILFTFYSRLECKIFTALYSFHCRD